MLIYVGKILDCATGSSEPQNRQLLVDVLDLPSSPHPRPLLFPGRCTVVGRREPMPITDLSCKANEAGNPLASGARQDRLLGARGPCLLLSAMAAIAHAGAM
jgi:hypothetical protein